MVKVEEVWKPIKDFEGYYEVSNLGRIRSLDREVPHKTSNKLAKEGTIISQFKSSKGYMQVTLHKLSKKRLIRVNRAVAESFLPNPKGLPIVGHINDVRDDNRVSNLKWMTQKENCNSKSFRKNVGDSLRNGSLSKKVYQRTLGGELIKEWDSASECGRNGFNQGNVSSCCRGEKKTYKNFIWEYES